MSTITRAHHDKNIPIDFLCEALNIPRATYYRHQRDEKSVPAVSRPRTPKNALSGEEKQQVLDLLRSEQFIDKTPYEAFNTLIDKGEYYCSTRTMYRVLGEQGESLDRRPQRNHRDAIKPELIATEPNEVW